MGNKNNILWGSQDGGKTWVKLADNCSKAEKARRIKDGWKVLEMANGDKPWTEEDEKEKSRSRANIQPFQKL